MGIIGEDDGCFVKLGAKTFYSWKCVAFFVNWLCNSLLFLTPLFMQEDPVLLVPEDKEQKPYVAIIKVKSLSNRQIFNSALF